MSFLCCFGCVGGGGLGWGGRVAAFLVTEFLRFLLGTGCVGASDYRHRPGFQATKREHFPQRFRQHGEGSYYDLSGLHEDVGEDR